MSAAMEVRIAAMEDASNQPSGPVIEATASSTAAPPVAGV